MLSEFAKIRCWCPKLAVHSTSTRSVCTRVLQCQPGCLSFLFKDLCQNPPFHGGVEEAANRIRTEIAIEDYLISWFWLRNPRNRTSLLDETMEG